MKLLEKYYFHLSNLFFVLYILQGAIMDKLPSKFYKNENNTDISLYQLYLSKLNENILKYERWNLFKEINISFNHWLQMILEFSESLSDNPFI